jgi:plastocyanin
VNRIVVLAGAFAVLSLTLTLTGWMFTRVAEHPGAPREVGELPSWFAGGPAVHGARARSSAPAGAAGEAAPALGHEAGAAVASIKPEARAPEKTAPAEGVYVDVAGGKVEIALTEYELTPGKIRIPPGKVTFVLRNEGRYSHDFNVEGPGIDTTTQKFGPGRTVRLEVSLQEGEYRISCPLSNHDERGMRGTLIVTSKLPGK